MRLSVLLVSVSVAACGDGSNGPGGGSGGADAAGVDARPGADADTAGGCGGAAETGVHTREIEVGGTTRSYLLSVPDGYDPDTPHALVYAWHGRGSNGTQARSYFGVEEAAGGAAIVVYPDGLEVSDTPDDTGWDLAANGVDVAFFDALHETLTAEMCIDPDRVFSTGHSFGGYLSNVLGCVRGDVLSAIAPVAGGGPYGGCTGQVAAFLVHGSADQVVPVDEGLEARDHWRTANGCSDQASEVDPAPCRAYADCAAPVLWCEHDDESFSGHGWPAFAPAGIWGFFAERDRG